MWRGTLSSCLLSFATVVPRADPLIGLAITVVILKITWDSWHIVSTTEPGETPHHHEH